MTLYNALSKELTYRDDMTLINRAAQMQQLATGWRRRKICRSISPDGGYEAGYLIGLSVAQPQCCD
ncbi:hypothetical protein KCP78_03840 [Salmonella enterica subsp. enterica]|nr:hypothetical protein KCP78_03840 [Salmonella enterica subsp. enterica]